MQLVKNKTKAFQFLILFSLLSFMIWRTEIEYHGWHGLTWLTYDPISIPIVLSLFVLWINIFFNFKNTPDRFILNLLLLFWIVVGSLLIINSLKLLFSYYSFFLTEWQLYLFNFIIIVVIPLFPFIALISLKLLKINVPKKYILGSQLLYLGAFPLAIFLLQLSNHKGGPNLIHAVKSGFVFPFLFFSFGWPLIYAFRKEIPPS